MRKVNETIIVEDAIYGRFSAYIVAVNTVSDFDGERAVWRVRNYEVRPNNPNVTDGKTVHIIEDQIDKTTRI